MNHQTLRTLSKYLSRAELTRLRNAANDVMGLEYRWKGLLERKIREMENRIINHIVNYGELPPDEVFDFTSFYTEHSVQVMRQGFETAYSAIEKSKDPPIEAAKRLAATTKSKVPRSLRELMEFWDLFRKKKTIPKRQQQLAERVKRHYLKRVQSVWEQHSDGFREGSSFDQVAVREALQRASKSTFSRAKMIVETETTYYYNQVRRTVYDASPDVTHYLFVAIRDSATTHWCKTRNGVVYTKGSALLDRETPPIHWNCRSELLPLTAHNPRHKALIDDLSLRRERRSCSALPAEWNRRAA